MAHEMHTRRRRRSQLPGSLGEYTFIRHLSGCIYLGVYTFIWVYIHLSDIYLGVYIWVYIHLSDIYLGVYIWVYIHLSGCIYIYPTFIWVYISGCIYIYLGVYTFIRHLSGCIYLGVYTFIWVYIHLSDIYLGVYIWVYIHLSDRPEGFRRLRLDTIKVVQLSLVDAALVQGFFLKFSVQISIIKIRTLWMFIYVYWPKCKNNTVYSYEKHTERQHELHGLILKCEKNEKVTSTTSVRLTSQSTAQHCGLARPTHHGGLARPTVTDHFTGPTVNDITVNDIMVNDTHTRRRRRTGPRLHTLYMSRPHAAKWLSCDQVQMLGSGEAVAGFVHNLQQYGPPKLAGPRLQPTLPNG